MIKDLFLLDTGYTTQSKNLVLQGGGSEKTHLPAQIPVFIHETSGVILFDTGYAEHFYHETRKGLSRLQRILASPHLSSEGSAAAQLKARGIDPCDVRYIILSHFHPDHIAGLKDFPHAKFVFKSEAYDTLVKASFLVQAKLGFLPGLLPEDFKDRCVAISKTTLRQGSLLLPGFSQGYDLLGDGSLWGIDLPGHAPGHLGVALEYCGKTFFFTADASYLYQGITDLVYPSPVLDLVLSDRRAFQDTLHRLNHLSQNTNGIVILPYHCPRTMERFSDAIHHCLEV